MILNQFIKLSLLIFTAAILTACGSSGWDISYEAPENIAHPNAIGRTITVHELRDVRFDQTRVAEVIETGGLMTQRTRSYSSKDPVSEIVSNAIEENLRAQGFEVVRSYTSLDSSNISTMATDLALGGEIRAFFVRQDMGRSVAAAGQTGTSANVNIAVQIVTSEGDLIWDGDLVSNLTRENLVILGIGRLDPKSLLEEALANAVNQLHSPQVRDRLWTALPTRTKVELMFLGAKF